MDMIQISKQASGAQIGKFNQSDALFHQLMLIYLVCNNASSHESNYCSISVHIILVHNNLDHNVQSRFFLASVLILLPWFVSITKSA